MAVEAVPGNPLGLLGGKAYSSNFELERHPCRICMEVDRLGIRRKCDKVARRLDDKWDKFEHFSLVRAHETMMMGIATSLQSIL